MDILWGGGRKQDEDYGSSKSDFCIFLAPKQGFEFPALSSSLCVLLWGRVVWPQIIFTQCWVSYVIDVDDSPWKLIVLTKNHPDQISSWPKIVWNKNCPDHKLLSPNIVLTKNCSDQKSAYPKICLSKNHIRQTENHPESTQPKIVLAENSF